MSQLIKNSQVLIPNVKVATSFFSRFLGLMGKKSIAEDQAVCFPRCDSIHTFFMRFPIDVILVGKEGEVVEVVEAMKPWRLMLPRKKVKHVIEMQAHLSKKLGIQPGEKIDCAGGWD